MKELNKIAHCLRYYDTQTGCVDFPKTNKELAELKINMAIFSKWAKDAS
mgnify:CR=1 FL=1